MINNKNKRQWRKTNEVTLKLGLRRRAIVVVFSGHWIWNLGYHNFYANVPKGHQNMNIFVGKRMLGRTDTRTCERKCFFQSIRTVWDISRDVLARIATCSLLTGTYRRILVYSIDYNITNMIYMAPCWLKSQQIQTISSCIVTVDPLAEPHSEDVLCMSFHIN